MGAAVASTDSTGSGRFSGGVMIFQSSAALSLDAKGRLAVPARHRDALMAECQGNLVLTAHPHGCLLLYPQSEWAPRCEKLMSRGNLKQDVAWLQRVLVGNAREEQMDAAGRVLVAPELRELAQLTKSVRLVGLGHYFELWDEGEWKRQQQEAIKKLSEVGFPSEFDDFSL